VKRVVIAGRPNVGKSTLFNRLSGTRRALIHATPGMTLSQIVSFDGGRRLELIDTGGLEYAEQPMSAFAGEIRAQTTAAIETSDLILFLVDGKEGITSEDRDIADRLRPYAERVVLVVNKIDVREAYENRNEFFELGYGDLVAVSAEHGTAIDELVDRIEAVVPPEVSGEDDEEEQGPIRIAIIGRPNVGKSSLVNRITREERSIVSEISGTTRDSIDTMIEREGKPYLIVDTAGIRRKAKTTDDAEKLAVISARHAIERCEVALVVIDGLEGVTAQDATVAGYTEEAGRAAMILVNKWDAVERTETLTREVTDAIRHRMKFLRYAPIEFISAKQGRRVEKLFPTIDRVAECFRTKIRTSELNRILEAAVRGHSPPSLRGRPRRFYYATQLRSGPPTIALFSNSAEPIHFSYRRYLENRFREELGLIGTPIHLVVRSRKGMKRE